MSFYCGCATAGNKVKWSAFAVFCALAIIFFIAYIEHTVQIGQKYEECMQPYSDFPKDSVIYENGKEKCEDQIRDDAKSTLRFLVLFILFAVGSSIPLYVMCCCTKKPEEVVVATGYATAAPTTTAAPYQKL